MPVTSAIAIYLLLWALVFFAVLPWRVETSREAGADEVSGQADSAPHAPRLRWKAKWTTIIATGIFALFYLNYVEGWVRLADLPWLLDPAASR